MVTLKPLTDAQTESLMRGLVGDVDLPQEARARIAALAEGNPLFVEETRADADRRWGPAIQRGTLDCRRRRIEHQHPSHHPRPYYRPAGPARARAASRPRVGSGRRTLVLVGRRDPSSRRPRCDRGSRRACNRSCARSSSEPYRSEIPQEDAFRFTHILIRDAAYQGIPKAARADMHERLAEWIELRTRKLAGEYEEILGYHLEQAHLAAARARSTHRADRRR